MSVSVIFVVRIMPRREALYLPQTKDFRVSGESRLLAFSKFRYARNSIGGSAMSKINNFSGLKNLTRNGYFIALIMLFEVLFSCRSWAEYQNLLVDDEVPSYPLCGAERVRGRSSWYGCPSLEKIYININQSGGNSYLIEESYKYIEETFADYKKRSKRTIEITIEKSKINDEKAIANPSDNAISMEFKYIESKNILEFLIVSKLYHFFGYTELKGAEGKPEILKEAYAKILVEKVFPSIYPDAITNSK